MIKKIFVIFFLMFRLHGKYPDNILTNPLFVRVEMVKDELEDAYENQLHSVMEYHQKITNDFGLGIINLQEYERILEIEVPAFSNLCLEQLRAVANQKITQQLPDATLDIVDMIQDYVEELHDQLSAYIFAFSLVDHVIAE